ncbi:MAG: S-layer homology domain-containing protein [Clostridia bacterium]|nr:S-layer homology domain-containing protein [Clostridia bacterium]
MKNIKRLLAVLLVCAMIVPMGIFVSAETPVLTNWYTMAGKYSASTHAIIAPKSNDYKIKNDGFTFTENEGGVSVHTATYAEFAGAYGASAITSKATTPLDGLTVVIQPDQFDFAVDSNGYSNSLGILWTEDPITELAGFDDASKSYTSGLCDAVRSGTNGLRHLIPVAPNATPGVPVANAKTENITGKALYVSVSNSYGEYDGTKTASNVNIVYYDGSYINQNDGHPGYRWSFTSRNSPQDPKGDSSGISSRFMEVDLTYGLVINVRADETHGYIVNINGTDYYKGKRTSGDDIDTPIIGYYPDANVDGTSHPALTNDDYAQKTERYLGSMTYARNDIDLTGLREVESGYLTVGAVSIKDQYITDHGCDYTVKNINTVPVADWKGETFPADHEHVYETETIDATCTEDGAKVFRCGCGNVYSERIAALGHDMKLDTEKSYDPTCTTKGREIKDCSRCDHHTDEWIKELGHNMDDWYVTTVATPEAAGIKTSDCTRCDYSTTKEYAYSGLDDVIEDWEITATNGISIIPGLEEAPMVDAVLNDDGSVLVKDYSLMTGLNASHNTVTKAINKHKTSINGFNATVTPVALNENFPDQYPESFSFALTNMYDKYNYATEYAAGHATKNLPEYYAGILANEVYRYGNIWGRETKTDMIKEHTISFTLMDYMPLNGNPMGTPDDGYYDIVFWSVRSGGNHWCDKVVYLDFPIKMGDPITFETFYEKDPETGNTYLSAGFNIDWENFANIFDMGDVINSQSEDAIYSFVVAAHSPTIANPDNAVESLSASSFVINSICGESAVDFDGYAMSSTVSWDDEGNTIRYPLETPHTHEDVTNNNWVLMAVPTCTENGIEAKFCTFCGESVEIKEIPANGTHTPADEWVIESESTYFVHGVKVLYCTVCGEAVETEELPLVEYVNPFIDVKDNHWFASTVEYCVKRGYVAGMTENTFVPTGNITRAQFLVMLAKLDGVDLEQYAQTDSGFEDVKVAHWFNKVVCWAVEKGYTSGISETKFGPNNQITRSQLARFFYVYSEKNGINVEGRADLSVFPDGASVREWAKESVEWAVNAGLISGVAKDGVNYLTPDGTATRAQATVMFKGYDDFRGIND